MACGQVFEREGTRTEPETSFSRHLYSSAISFTMEALQTEGCNSKVSDQLTYQHKGDLSRET